MSDLDYLQEPDLPPSLYEASVAGSRTEYPTLQGAMDADVCVIGGGMAGLHTALALVESGRSVVVLEGRRVGWGASGRNGGHAIQEFGCGMTVLERELGEDGAKQCWRMIHEAAQRLRARIAEGIDCEYQPLHIEAALTVRNVCHLKEWQTHAASHYGHKPRFLDATDMRTMVGSTRYAGGLLDESGGHLNPLKLTLGLASQFVAKGGQLFENSPVRGWSELPDGRIQVETSGAPVRARAVVLAANVGISEIKTSLATRLARRILPVGTWIIATEPLTDAQAKEVLPCRAAVADNRAVLDYYRLSQDNRMVFGGGCSYLGKATPQGFANSIRNEMVRVFPQLEDVPTSHAWGGVIDISMTRTPDTGVETLSGGARIFHAQGFSGSGVVSSCAVGHALAQAVLGKSEDFALLSKLRSWVFPGGKLFRAQLVALGMAYQRLRDAI